LESLGLFPLRVFVGFFFFVTSGLSTFPNPIVRPRFFFFLCVRGAFFLPQASCVGCPVSPKRKSLSFFFRCRVELVCYSELFLVFCHTFHSTMGPVLRFDRPQRGKFPFFFFVCSSCAESLTFFFSTSMPDLTFSSFFFIVFFFV